MANEQKQPDPAEIPRHPVSYVAGELKLTTGRVRQLCTEFGFGKVPGTRILLLTDNELEELRHRPDRRTNAHSLAEAARLMSETKK